MTHHPKTASPLGNHFDDGPVPILLTFNVSSIRDSNNNLVSDIEPREIRCEYKCEYKNDLVCLIQSSGYAGTIWLSSKGPDGSSYEWCIRLDKQGMTQKFWWGVPWDGTYHISLNEPNRAGGPTGTLVVGTTVGDGDRSGRRT